MRWRERTAASTELWRTLFFMPVGSRCQVFLFDSDVAISKFRLCTTKQGGSVRRQQGPHATVLYNLTHKGGRKQSLQLLGWAA